MGNIGERNTLSIIVPVYNVERLKNFRWLYQEIDLEKEENNSSVWFI